MNPTCHLIPVQMIYSLLGLLLSSENYLGGGGGAEGRNTSISYSAAKVCITMGDIGPWEKDWISITRVLRHS